MTSVYDLLRLRCGLSQAEAAEFHSARLDTVKSWCSGRRPAPDGPITELRDLYGAISAAAADLAEIVRRQRSTDEDGIRIFQIGLPLDDKDARKCGFPTASTCESAVAIAITMLPAGSRVRAVPRVQGSIPTAVAPHRSAKMSTSSATASDLKLLRDIVHNRNGRHVPGLDRRPFERLEAFGWLKSYPVSLSDVQFEATDEGRRVAREPLE